jgi:hypothetical protein
MATRFVSDQPLRVSPAILGRPLASPLRRLIAAAVDSVPLFGLMVAVALGAAALSLRANDRAGFDALRLLWNQNGSPESLHRARREAARLLTRLDAPGLPPAVALAVEEGRLDDAATALATRDLKWDLNLGESEPVLVVGGSRETVPPSSVRVPLEKLIPARIRVLVILCVPALYFTLLTRLWGTTLGKRLCGLRVVRLDAEPLSLLEAFERFTGYLHIPAFFGWPLVDLWRDPNRQLPHDRTVHTVVIRARRERRAKVRVEAGPPPERAAPLPESRPPSPPAAKA